MAEIIYTEIDPNEINQKTVDLVESIKRDGIKYPLVVQCNNKIKTIKGCFDVGNQRNIIALSLCLEKIPVILYSVHNKTGFTGQNITDVNDLIEIFGENVKNEPVYECVANVIKKIRLKNDYPPDPLNP